MVPDFFRHYITHIPLLDGPHATMVVDMEEIAKLFKQKEFEKLHNALVLLETTLIAHLIDEDDFMDKINYPYAKYHKIAHSEILKKMANLIDKIDEIAAKHYDSKHLVEELRKILVEHIDHYDMQISNYVKQDPELCKLYFRA